MNPNPDPTRAQLFLDDTGIEDARFVSRQWHPPIKFPDPVLKAEHPWERWCPVAYGTVLHWRGKFRAWYCGWTRDERPRACYAESVDGITWEKPPLEICEFAGSRRNNIILNPAGERRIIDDLAVIDDPEDESWPLKMLYWEGEKHDPKDKSWGIWLARSKDGIHWDRSPGLVLPHWGDRFNGVSVKVDGRYVVYGRKLGSWVDHGRCVWRTESRDLRRWSGDRLVLHRDAEDPLNMEYYSASVFPYESVTLGGLERMYLSPDWLDTELIWSHDGGRSWKRAGHRPAFLSPSNGPRHWDDTWVNLPTNPPIRHRGRLWFYYSGRSGAHGACYPLNHGGIGLAILRIDGFASLRAGEREGWVLTRPMNWPDAGLHVNVDPRRNTRSHPGYHHTGELRVEVRDSSNRPIPGFTWNDCHAMTRNTEDHPDGCAAVTWKTKSLRRLAGRRIRLAFRMRDAHLYSFRARERTDG
ncbi:MAG: hypothetical protein HUU04_01995 [Verrucomicrobiae bacterium]|nr:hypothetical protein [Verrucomicrobiae bacterium]